MDRNGFDTADKRRMPENMKIDARLYLKLNM